MSPEIVVGLVALTAMGMFGCWRLVRWFFEGQAGPNPWDEETERRIHQPDAVPICTRCLEPHPAEARFCPSCNIPVDSLVSLSPYLYAFALGDVLRTGTTRKFKVNWITVTGFLLLPTVFLLFPFGFVYWFFFLRNLSRQRTEPAATSPKADDSHNAGAR